MPLFGQEIQGFAQWDMMLWSWSGVVALLYMGSGTAVRPSQCIVKNIAMYVAEETAEVLGYSTQRGGPSLQAQKSSIFLMYRF